MGVGAMSEFKKGNEVFLTEELVIMGVVDDAWLRDSLPDDTLVFSGLNHQNVLLINDGLDAVESERKDKDEAAWTHHGLSQYL